MKRDRVTLLWGGCAGLIGLLGLAGWFLDSDLLRRVAPQLPPMHPLTATLLIVCAYGLAAVPYKRKAARAAAILVALVAALRLGYADQIRTLLLEHIPSAPILSPGAGKMALGTAVALVLLASAIVCASSTRRQLGRVSELLALLGGLIGIFALVGHVLQIAPLYSFNSHYQIAAHTGLAIVLLMLGILSLHRESGLIRFLFDSGSAGRLARIVLPVGLLLQAAIAIARLSGQAAGWYDSETGVALHLGASVVTTLGLLGFALFRLARSEILRQEQERELELARVSLLHLSRDTAMATMAAALAHELNQPLTALSNYAAGLRRMTSSADPADPIAIGLSAVEANAQRAGEIIRRMRKIAMTGVAQGESLDVAKLVEDVARLIHMDWPAHRITAQCMNNGPVHADPIQIEQVLLNLLRNACEALGPREGGDILVTSSDHDRYIQVCISDNGPGVEPDVLANLFDAQASAKSDGMGIGLSICRTIVEAQGGSITGTNLAGGGARFCFTLPRSEV
jgi:signal transduction histidine kinase